MVGGAGGARAALPRVSVARPPAARPRYRTASLLFFVFLVLDFVFASLLWDAVVAWMRGEGGCAVDDANVACGDDMRWGVVISDDDGIV